MSVGAAVGRAVAVLAGVAEAERPGDPAPGVAGAEGRARVQVAPAAPAEGRVRAAVALVAVAARVGRVLGVVLAVGVVRRWFRGLRGLSWLAGLRSRLAQPRGLGHLLGRVRRQLRGY